VSGVLAQEGTRSSIARQRFGLAATHSAAFGQSQTWADGARPIRAALFGHLADRNQVSVEAVDSVDQRV
jgi:hypothetical protein